MVPWDWHGKQLSRCHITQVLWCNANTCVGDGFLCAQFHWTPIAAELAPLFFVCWAWSVDRTNMCYDINWQHKTEPLWLRVWGFPVSSKTLKKLKSNWQESVSAHLKKATINPLGSLCIFSCLKILAQLYKSQPLYSHKTPITFLYESHGTLTIWFHVKL